MDRVIGMGEHSLADDVLFVGHSLVGVEIPLILEQAVESQGGTGSVRFQVINGAPLAWNWEHSATAQGVDARAVLPGGETEVVVLTEAIPLANHLAWSDTVGNARRFYDLAVAAEPTARVYLYETWHSLDSGTGVDVPYDDDDETPWRRRLEQDFGRWQGIVDAVNAGRPAGAEPMRLIPAGQALARLDDAIAAGSVPGITDIRQLFEDDIHPNPLGDYFVAMVHYAAIFGRDPRGLPHQLRNEWGEPLPAPAPALAARMQEIAWEVVGQGAAAEAGLPDGLAFGLAGIADWSTQQPFIDIMKSARPWVGHLPGQWGGWDHADLAAEGALDPAGWPRRIPEPLTGLSPIVLSEQPEEAASLAGRSRLTYDGEGTIEIGGRATVLARRPGEILFDYAPGPGHVAITITATDPRGRGAYIRDIAVVHEALAPLHAAGARFNPSWLARIRGAAAVRFMDWMRTNDSTARAWADRPRPEHYTYALAGVPVEVMVDLANTVAADPWFTMPHRADDDYVRRFAAYVRDRLAPERRAFVEFSNELWNFKFGQSRWARGAAEARWGADAPGDAWIQLAGLRAAEVADIWKGAFGAASTERLVRVVATQTDWLGLEAALLEAPLGTAAGWTAPHEHFDAYAVTGYFGAALGGDAKAPQVLAWISESRMAAEAAAADRGLTGVAAVQWVEAHAYDRAIAMAAAELRDGSVTGDDRDSVIRLVCEVLPYHAAVADAQGMDLVMYEGGAHVAGTGPWLDSAELTAFFVELSYAPEMAELYELLLAGWRAAGGEVFNAFVDVAAPSRFGSWGALRHLDDENPRWDALTTAPPAAPPCETAAVAAAATPLSVCGPGHEAAGEAGAPRAPSC